MKKLFNLLLITALVVGVCSCDQRSENTPHPAPAPVDPTPSPEVDVAEELAKESKSAQKFREYYREYRRLSEQSGVNLNRAQLGQLSEDIKENKNKAEFWGSIWAEDLERAIEAAELSGDSEAREQYQKELSNVEEILQSLRKSDNEDSNNSDDNGDIDDSDNDVSDVDADDM